MFCPNCGANQSNTKRFCTSCGTNLEVVSQALSGQLPVVNNYVPPPPLAYAQQEDLRKGIKLMIFGGTFILLRLISFIFTAPFRGGSLFGFWSFVAGALFAVGLAKFLSARAVLDRQLPHVPQPAPMPAPPQARLHMTMPQAPQPVFSAAPIGAETGDLPAPPQPAPSVTEDDTKHLPRGATN